MRHLLILVGLISLLAAACAKSDSDKALLAQREETARYFRDMGAVVQRVVDGGLALLRNIDDKGKTKTQKAETQAQLLNQLRDDIKAALAIEPPACIKETDHYRYLQQALALRGRSVDVSILLPKFPPGQPRGNEEEELKPLTDAIQQAQNELVQAQDSAGSAAKSCGLWGFPKFP